MQREYESYLKTENDFWTMISEVFHKINRVIEPFGKVVINFADRYANAAILGRPLEVLYSPRYESIMESAGFDLFGRIIWDKTRVYINDAKHLAGEGNKTGQMRVSPNFEYLFIWRKNSSGKPPVKAVDMTDAERVSWTDAVWSIPSVNVNENASGFKFAKFPEEIPFRFLKMYTQENDLVLDPFAGTCTTTKVARDLGRRSICIERNSAMRGYIEGYLNQQQANMFQENFDVEIVGGYET